MLSPDHKHAEAALFSRRSLSVSAFFVGFLGVRSSGTQGLRCRMCVHVCVCVCGNFLLQAYIRGYACTIGLGLHESGPQPLVLQGLEQKAFRRAPPEGRSAGGRGAQDPRGPGPRPAIPCVKGFTV